MDKFNRGGFGGNRGGGNRFGGNRGGGFGGNKDRREVVMHDAVCDDCHKKCQVPFRPSGDKPVYCSDCFGGKRESAPRQSFDNAPRRDFSPKPQDDGVRKQLEAINMKLDGIMRMMSKPTAEEKPKAKKTVKK
ncbi:MAG: CxxC-x17-CxxC domain-containing protein [Candidatus Paceibacterota bacterium]|jgi:CxxC-x17-CxxC domain-containing protein